EAEAREKTARFEKLPTVDKVVTLFDFVPKEQEEKLAIIEELGLLLGTQLQNFPAPAEGGVQIETLEMFQKAVEDRLAKKDDPELTALAATLEQFHEQLMTEDASTREASLDKLQGSLLNSLPATIRNLAHGLQATEITLDNLPADMAERWRSPSGIYRVQIVPKKDLNDLENLREFIHEGQKVDPDVTDLPVTYLESMNEVVKAFQQAFGIALAAITILLLLILRSFKDTVLVLLPLLLASLFTAAATVILDVPFNFANIIALPLLFGLGVDNGIHMTHRIHYLQSRDDNLLGTSEALGVFYGSLTTIWSFGSLTFMSHKGTASMGILLAIGLLLSLVCSLVVLPAFSALKFRHGT
ncbi:MAG: putative rane protein, partial [Proteobacteria bacterium]|nr:putative rane protein [Pseudomonadota bacterium]